MIKPLSEDIKEALSIMNELIIAQAVKKDLPIILDIQRKAFMEVARFFNLKISATDRTDTGKFNRGICQWYDFESIYRQYNNWICACL